MQRSVFRSHRGAYAALAVLFIATIIVQGTFTVDVVRILVTDYPTRPIQIGRPWPTITSLNDAASKSGLRRGQRIVTIEGKTPHGTGDLASAVRARKPGEPLSVSVQEDGVTVEHRVVLQPAVERVSALFALFVTIVAFLMPWLSIAVGFWVAALRPADRRAWLVLG